MRDYREQISEFWPTIMQAWEAHADKRPVIECDLANKKVRAYASGEYIDSLVGTDAGDYTGSSLVRWMKGASWSSSWTARTVFSSRIVSPVSGGSQEEAQQALAPYCPPAAGNTVNGNDGLIDDL